MNHDAKQAAQQATQQAIQAVQHCTSMTEVRARIDALDDILVPLLVQRVGYMTQAARIKHEAAQVRDEDRIQFIVDRVRQQGAAEGGQPDVLEAIYRSMMEACIAHEHQEFARLREQETSTDAPPLSASAPSGTDGTGATGATGGSAAHAVISVGAA